MTGLQFLACTGLAWRVPSLLETSLMTANRRALLAAGLALPFIRTAAAQTPLRFSLDWALQGNHGMWALAEDRGIFRREGLAVRVDRGFGSGDALVKVASGAYDIGFADISGAVKFNAENPGNRLVSIYQVFDRTAAALVTLRGRGIERVQDAAGKRLGAPEGEGSRLLFPAFARAAGSTRAASAGPPWRQTCATPCCGRARWMR
jgi:NitT/TauT family transport system substrate-binding protein